MITKKRNKRKKKVNKDIVQDKQIKLLKKELKKLANKVLKNVKNKIGSEKYKKLKSKIMDKFNLAKTKSGIRKMTNNLLNTPYQNIPSQLARDAQSNLRTATQEVKENIKSELSKEFENPIKEYNKMKEDLNNVIEKYNNGDLNIIEVIIAYKSAKKFANSVGEYLPTVSELNSTYRSVKNKLNYLRSWASSRLRSGDTITPIQDLPPPSPPPSSSPDPPPPPEPEPEPSPSPSPAPTEQPTMSRIYDSAQQTIENNNPFIQRTGTALVGLGMLEGTTRLYNRLYRNNRNRDIVQDRLQDAGATMAGRLSQEASQAVLNQINSDTVDNVNAIRNIRERMDRSSLERQTNRAALRQRDREIRDRQQMGNNIIDEGILERSQPNPQGDLVRNPLFGIKSRTKEFVTPSTARKNRSRLQAEEGQADLRNRILENTRENQPEEIEEVDEDMPDLEDEMELEIED